VLDAGQDRQQPVRDPSLARVLAGGSFNPARSLDPVLFNFDFGKIWIYLLGPFVGGAIGGAIWVLFGPTPMDQPATIRATGGVPQASVESERGRGERRER